MTNIYLISVTQVVAVLAVRSELLSGQSNSLITGKIQGNSPISGAWRVLGPRNLNGLAGKFPKRQNRETNQQNREFSLRTRELYPDAASALRNVLCRWISGETGTHGKNGLDFVRDGPILGATFRW